MRVMALSNLTKNTSYYSIDSGNKVERPNIQLFFTFSKKLMILKIPPNYFIRS